MIVGLEIQDGHQYKKKYILSWYPKGNTELYMHIKYEQKILIGSGSKACQNQNDNNFKMGQNTNLIFTRGNVLI